MSLQDLREYVARLEEEDQIQRIKEEVDWNLEIGAIIRRACDLGAPAPLFEKVKGYPRGFRVLGAPVGASAKKRRFYARIAISLGLPPDTGPAELVEYFVRGKGLTPIPPRLVETAPCKQNIQLGDEVDLLKFPIPYIHQHDGGRYIGTWDTVVTKDPESDWVNWGLYRLMVHDGRTIGGMVLPTQHIGLHYAKYEARNEPMPFAIVLGTEPMTPLIASTGMPVGVSESGVIGALQGKPVEVVKCETVDLEVPASAEIVIEGYMPPHERREEGPFGEYTGYQARNKDVRPVYKVTAVTHRDDPIIPVVAAGVPVEDHVCMSIIMAADVLHSLREANLPVGKVFIPPASALHMVIVSVTDKPSRFVEKISDAVWSTKTGVMIPRIVIVDDDIDATDMNQVLWALSTRNHPGRGIRKCNKLSVHPLWPFLTPEEKKKASATTVVFDCTWRRGLSEDKIPRKASFDSLWPKEIQEKVLGSWEQFGYSAG
ncbi:MAG: UbiD family decarboxylase [Chloroflexi bacterium]|nr:UbiD family decarboxylase [Chloroflexota bacterium]